MLCPERFITDRANWGLVRGEMMRFKMLTRIAAVRGYFAAQHTSDLALTGRLAVALGKVVQIRSVTHYNLIRS